MFEECGKVLFKLRYCPSNKHGVKIFFDSIEGFIEGKIMLIILWSSKNIKSLFPLKDKVAHPSYLIYEGQSSCKLSYIGKTKRNNEVRWREHKDLAKK